MPDHIVSVGNVQMVSLFDGEMETDPLQLFPESTSQLWTDEFPGLLDEAGTIQMPIGSTAVRSGGKLVLVDTGMQDVDARLMEDMRRKGVNREEVDLVVMTHLHLDHVGWNMTDGRPTFPNARYLVPRKDWDFWTQPHNVEENECISQQVLPLQELRIMDLIDDEYDVTDELKVLVTPGHTPGHISILISSSGAQGFILGDVSHSPIQAHYTDWSIEYDNDPGQAAATRNKIMDRLEADGGLVFACHYPMPGFGRYVRVDGRRRWEPL